MFYICNKKISVSFEIYMVPVGFFAMKPKDDRINGITPLNTICPVE